MISSSERTNGDTLLGDIEETSEKHVHEKYTPSYPTFI